MKSIVGTWNLTVDWGNTGSPVQASPMTFNSDGSWTYQYGGGKWTQSEGYVSWTFDNAAGLIYSGYINSLAVQGGMGYTGNTNVGSFYMLPSSGTTLTSDATAKTSGADEAVGKK